MSPGVTDRFQRNQQTETARWRLGASGSEARRLCLFSRHVLRAGADHAAQHPYRNWPWM